jgi:hypothetical protein
LFTANNGELVGCAYGEDVALKCNIAKHLEIREADQVELVL